MNWYSLWLGSTRIIISSPLDYHYLIGTSRMQILLKANCWHFSKSDKGRPMMNLTNYLVDNSCCFNFGAELAGVETNIWSSKTTHSVYLSNAVCSCFRSFSSSGCWLFAKLQCQNAMTMLHFSSLRISCIIS